MIELFAEIPEYRRRQHRLFIDIILKSSSLPDAAALLSEYTNCCPTQIEKDFIAFCIALRKEIADEGNTNQR